MSLNYTEFLKQAMSKTAARPMMPQTPPPQTAARTPAQVGGRIAPAMVKASPMKPRQVAMATPMGRAQF